MKQPRDIQKLLLYVVAFVLIVTLGWFFVSVYKDPISSQERQAQEEQSRWKIEAEKQRQEAEVTALRLARAKAIADATDYMVDNAGDCYSVVWFVSANRESTLQRNLVPCSAYVLSQAKQGIQGQQVYVSRESIKLYK